MKVGNAQSLNFEILVENSIINFENFGKNRQINFENDYFVKGGYRDLPSVILMIHGI